MRLLAPGFIAIAALGLGLAACGGGTHSTIPAASQGASQTTTGGARTTTVTFEIDVPMTGSGKTRHPKYLSPATSSLAYIVTDSAGTTVIGENCLNLGSAVQSCQTPVPTSPPATQFAPVSTCQSQGLTEPVACSVTYDLPNLTTSGTYTFTIATYDNTLAAPCDPRPASSSSLCAATNRHVLSLASFAQTLTYEGSNFVAVTLGGVPASIAVRPLQPGYLQLLGNQLKLWGSSAQQITVEPLDAAGDIIVGAGAPSLSVSGSGTTALNVTAASSVAPNVFTLQAPTSGSPPAITPGIVDLTFTATLGDGATYPGVGSPSTLSATVPVTIEHSAIYVSAGSQYTVYAYYDGSTSPNASLVFADPPSGIAVDANGTLYVADPTVNEIYTCPAGASSASACAVRISAGLSGPKGMAVDAAGQLWVADGSHVYVYPPGAALPSTTFTTATVSPPTAYAVAPSPDGSFWVSTSAGILWNCAAGATLGSACSTIANVTTIYGVTTDAFGDAYYTDYTGANAYTCIGGCLSSKFLSTDTHPMGLAVDAAGTVYIASTGAGKVASYTAGGTLGLGYLSVTGAEYVAVVPGAVVP